MDCPDCKSPDLEIGESEIKGKFAAKVWYASCDALVGEDPNWGGGHPCEFFAVRESKKTLMEHLEILEKSRKLPEDTCPYCGGKGKESVSMGGDKFLVRCRFCSESGKK
jgi:hypothetical protein